MRELVTGRHPAIGIELLALFTDPLGERINESARVIVSEFGRSNENNKL